MEARRPPNGCASTPAAIAISLIAGTIVGAIVDGNGFYADDAYLIGLWCGFVAIGFSIVADVQRTWTPYGVTVACWVAGTCLLEAISNGEGDGVVAVMGKLGLLSAVVRALVALCPGGRIKN